MRRRRRIRRVLKWAGVAALAVIIAANIFSAWWEIDWISPYHDRWISCANGTVSAEFMAGAPRGEVFFILDTTPGWAFERTSKARMTWRPSFQKVRASFRPVEVWTIVVPLWMPFLILAAPTGLLWWLDRPPPRGHCQQCGYDLTGNVSGRCPECGTEILANSRPAELNAGIRT